MTPDGVYSAAQSWQPEVFSLVLYTFLVFVLIVVLLFLSSRLGHRKEDPKKAMPYECGVIPSGSARPRYPVPFYLVAVFFVIFDVEAAFIFSWAVAVDALGWIGWMRISFFIILLLLSLIYVWRKGGLDWVPGTIRKNRT
jgi:NADH-quinone oxidoreductase subunit A